MKTGWWAVVLCCGLVNSEAARADDAPHGDAPAWDYSGPAGPEHWAELDPAFRFCAGKNQSPVNLTGGIDAALPPLVFSYGALGREIFHNGHTVQIDFPAGSSLSVDGLRFELLQIHFHAPSENLIEGRSYPLEGHLVHADAAGNLAVVAVMFVEGPENPGLAAVAPPALPIPARQGERRELARPVDARGFLPAHLDDFRFSGSLTTPPCSEGVRWMVLRQPATASPAQLEALRRALGEANNRPVQPLYARPVLE